MNDNYEYWLNEFDVAINNNVYNGEMINIIPENFRTYELCEFATEHGLGSLADIPTHLIVIY